MQNFIKNNFDKILGAIVSLILAYVVLWGDSRWVSNLEYKDKIQPGITAMNAHVSAVSSRVLTLEEWKLEQKAAQAADAAKFAELSKELAELKSKLDVHGVYLELNSKSTERILRLLESDRVNYTKNK